MVASNAIARAFSPAYEPGQNFLRWRLVEPAAKGFFVDWDEATDITVSGLRKVAGSASNDPAMRALIDELSTRSARFRELWARAEVGYREGILHVRHPLVGELYLRRNRLSVPNSGGQHLIVFYADPDSPTAERWRNCDREQCRLQLFIVPDYFRRPFTLSAWTFSFPMAAAAKTVGIVCMTVL